MRRLLFGVLFVVLTFPCIVSAKSFQIGDEIWVARKRLGITAHHAGVYVGKGKVVHVNARFWESTKRVLKGKHFVFVEQVSLSKFAEGDTMKKGPAKPAFSRERIVKRALAQVGNQFRYKPWTNNCQHFTWKIITGRAHSPEAEKFKKIAAAEVEELRRKAKKTGKKIKKGIKKAGKGIKKGFVKVGKGIKKGLKKAGEGLKKGVQKLASKKSKKKAGKRKKTKNRHAPKKRKKAKSAQKKR